MIRENILDMVAYKPPLEDRRSGDMLLDFNERTTGLPPWLLESVCKHIRRNQLHIYPEYGRILSFLAEYTGMEADQVMLTNGSDQGIDIIVRAVAMTGDEAIVPIPTFAMLTHSCEVSGLKLITPSYSFENGYPFDQVRDSVSENTKIIVVCNPNSPTGTLLEPKLVAELARMAPKATVLVDECYYEFSKKSVKDWVNELDNLFITRTFSKTWGLAALRLGYVISQQRNIEQLLKIRGPYDVNMLAVVAAQEALKEPEFMHEYIKEVEEIAKPKLLNYLSDKGIRFWPTQANFVLVYPPDGVELAAGLGKQGIRTRPRGGPGIDGTVRITIGTEQDTHKLIAALDKVLQF